MNDIKITALKSKTIYGMGILLARELFIKILAIIGQFILIRILTPDIFGQVAIILFILSFVDLFSDLGLTQALIQQKEEINKKKYSSILFLKLIISGAVILILFVFSPFIVKAYGLSNELVLFIYILLFASIFKVIKEIPIAMYERKLNYKIIPTIDILGVLVYYVTAIVLASQNFGIASLVYSIVCKEFVEVVAVYIYKPYFPIFHFNFSEIKHMIKFGVPLQINTLVAFAHRSLTTAIGSITTSTYALGLLDWSLNIASVPRAVNENFGRVAFSSFSRLQDNTEILQKAVEQSIRILTLIALFFIVHTVILGQEFIYLIADEKWIDAYYALVWLVPTAFFFSITATLGHAILAIGKAKDFLIATVTAVICETIVTIVFAYAFGYVGIAVGAFVGSITLFLTLHYTFRSWEFWIPIIQILIQRTTIFIICILSSILLPSNTMTITSFVFKVLIVSLIYIISVWLIAKEDIMLIVRLRKSFIK